KVLLEFDFCASFFQLLLSFFGIFFGNAFLNGLGCTVNQFFGFFQAKTGDFTNNLNNADLVSAKVVKDQVEFGLLFGSTTGVTASSGCPTSSPGGATGDTN